MRLGTRASELALVQAREVARLLGENLVEASLVEISTSGDRGVAMSDKARWTSEIELALMERRIDVAVHSCKDVPGELAGDTEIVIPEREDPRDVLCGASSLDELPEGARVGTASLRRAAQLKAVRPDLRIVELRGNIDTRLHKLQTGRADAIVLAYAGLKRIGRETEAGCVLEALVPAAGQGALALQIRSTDSEIRRDVRVLRHLPSSMCVSAERALTLALGASCNTAVGAFATRKPPGGEPMRGAYVHLTGWVGLPDGSEWISDSAVGGPDDAAAELAERMIAAGAKDLLARAEEFAGGTERDGSAGEDP